MDSGKTIDNEVTAMDSGKIIDNGVTAMDSGKTIDNGSTAMDSGSKKPSKTKLNSFGLVLNVDKNYKETSIKSFDFVLNKSIEVKTTDAKNNSFDFVLDRNYILKDKINKNKSLDVNISGSSSEYLVNRRFEGVLKGCSSERKGFEESTAMDSGSTIDNGITAMDSGSTIDNGSTAMDSGSKKYLCQWSCSRKYMHLYFQTCLMLKKMMKTTTIICPGSSYIS